MTTTLLRSGKIEHFRALGETGQPVYHSALQLRKVISRRLPGQERHLAIPQRDQQGEGVDWYSGIAGDVVPWSSATEDEREDARIQLEAFRQEVIKLNQAPPESQGGDHEVFTRLVKWVSHFPDDISFTWSTVHLCSCSGVSFTPRLIGTLTPCSACTLPQHHKRYNPRHQPWLRFRPKLSLSQYNLKLSPSLQYVLGGGAGGGCCRFFLHWRYYYYLVSGPA